MMSARQAHGHELTIPGTGLTIQGSGVALIAYKIMASWTGNAGNS